MHIARAMYCCKIVEYLKGPNVVRSLSDGIPKFRENHGKKRPLVLPADQEAFDKVRPLFRLLSIFGHYFKIVAALERTLCNQSTFLLPLWSQLDFLLMDFFLLLRFIEGGDFTGGGGGSSFFVATLSSSSSLSEGGSGFSVGIPFNFANL